MIDINAIINIDSQDDFSRKALESFLFQAEACPPYREYLSMLGVTASDVSRAVDIPHIPIEVFRSRKVYCGPQEPEKVFTSSTTGGDIPSEHYVKYLEDYRAVLRKAFSLFYGDPAGWSLYALLPGYLEREGSSLVWMADDLIKLGGGGFFLNDYDELLRQMEADKGEKILLGVTYALLDLAEKYAPNLSGTVVMETGGMKGRRQEIPKNELHRILSNAFGVNKIHSEYGMAELTSQAYSNGDGIFRTPPWMKVTIRDINDPGTLLPMGKTGGINISDLGNLYSCAFIQTQDMGYLNPDGSFVITGRIEGSQTRGCNLLVD